MNSTVAQTLQASMSDAIATLNSAVMTLDALLASRSLDSTTQPFHTVRRVRNQLKEQVGQLEGEISANEMDTYSPRP